MVNNSIARNIHPVDRFGVRSFWMSITYGCWRDVTTYGVGVGAVAWAAQHA
jgi:hypothetical protein